MTPLVFLDCETTGLDPRIHDVVEIAWAVGDAEIQTAYPAHRIDYADPRALEVNGYYARGLDLPDGPAGTSNLGLLTRDLCGATIVGCNPAFDAAFLLRKIGHAPWHHRLINVAEGGMWAYGWDRPRGLRAVATALRGDGYEIAEPDHTAAGDVRCTRDVYRALRSRGETT